MHWHSQQPALRETGRQEDRAVESGGPHSRRLCSRRAWLWGALAALCGRPVKAAAETRPIRLVVPFPAGGPADALGRALAQALGRQLDAPVFVDNVAGATGQRAAAQVAHAQPDGLTLLLGTSATHAVAPSLSARLPYHPTHDFVAIGRVCTTRMLLVAHPSFPARSLSGMITAARAAPVPLSYGSWGVGSVGHLTVEALRMQSGIALTHVPYPGIAPMMQSLLGAQIPLAVSDTAGALALVREGRVRPLAISGGERLPALPEVTTLAEAGVASDPDAWYAMFAPAGLPAAVRTRLEAALRAALVEPTLIEALGRLALEPGLLDHEAFQRLWQDDIATWQRIVAAAGITLN
jgi:tripartite-type tricarboxylate transporter receptor subunit TctC